MRERAFGPECENLNCAVPIARREGIIHDIAAETLPWSPDRSVRDGYPKGIINPDGKNCQIISPRVAYYRRITDDIAPRET